MPSLSSMLLGRRTCVSCLPWEDCSETPRHCMLRHWGIPRMSPAPRLQLLSQVHAGLLCRMLQADLAMLHMR